MPVGPFELIIILVIIIIFFGVGKLPQIGGALGEGIREFRSSAKDDEEEEQKLEEAENPQQIEAQTTRTNEPAKEEL